jgi:hypothetical protein
MKDTANMLKNQLKDDSGIHPLDKQFQSLGMNEMTPLEHKSQEFTEIDAYLNCSKGQTHHLNYNVQEIFRIERQGEFERFDKSKYAKIASNRRLLWHGSRVTNYGGILGQGLRIAPPEAPATGYMFGKGIYLADMSSKSANYCNAQNSGGTALLLLCEAELGNPMHELTDASYTAGDDAINKGMYSTWGMGKTGPKKWKDASCVHPALKGCTMVRNSFYCLDASQANDSLPSPICRRRLDRPTFPAHISCTMSTLPMTSRRSSSGTCFVSACKRFNLDVKLCVHDIFPLLALLAFLNGVVAKQAMWSKSNVLPWGVLAHVDISFSCTLFHQCHVRFLIHTYMIYYAVQKEMKTDKTALVFISHCMYMACKQQQTTQLSHLEKG